MIIYTTAEQDKMIGEWYRPHVKAHHEEGCEPPGYTLQINLGIPDFYGYSGTVVCGADRLEIGDVRVDFEN